MTASGRAVNDRQKVRSRARRMRDSRLLGWQWLEGLPELWRCLRYSRCHPGLEKCSKLPEPIFTPATKSDEGHDENISFEQMVDAVGLETATTLRDRSMSVYERGCEYAAAKGIILADTKFEWGLHEGELILIDEVLTPDSSRFWPADTYCPGQNQFSFDKQFVRDWLETTDWDKESAPPELPAEVISKTRDKYIEAYERLTEQSFKWK